MACSSTCTALVNAYTVCLSTLSASILCDWIWENQPDGIFVQIELLIPSECAFHCTSIGAIDTLIRHNLLYNDVNTCYLAISEHTHQRSECVLNGLLMVDNDSTVFLEPYVLTSIATCNAVWLCEQTYWKHNDKCRRQATSITIVS